MPFKRVHKIDQCNAVALRFLSEKTFDKALWILAGEEARNHEFGFPGEQVIIMDKEDKELLQELESDYKEEEVAKPNEISQEELSQLRYKNFSK